MPPSQSYWYTVDEYKSTGSIRVKCRNSNRLSVLCLPRCTCNMCLLFSSGCFREEYRGRLDTVSQYHWSHLHIKPGFPPGMSPFSSGLAGSLSSSLHENYSMGKLKECGVHSVEQLAQRHIHSLATQRVQEAQEKRKASRD